MELIGNKKLRLIIGLVSNMDRHLRYFVAKTVKLSPLATWRPCRVSPDLGDRFLTFTMQANVHTRLQGLITVLSLVPSPKGACLHSPA